MSPGRLIASCAAVLAAALLMLGCGGSGDPVQVDLPPETVAAINLKLDQIEQRFGDDDCTGPNSAETSLDSLKAAVDGLGVEQQFIDDMNEMLDNLGKQIADQCQEPDRTTPPPTTDTLPTTTTPTTTDTIPTTTETTTEETTETTTATDTTDTEPTGPPTTPGGGGNGGGPGGAITPGGGKKRKAAKLSGGGRPAGSGGVKATGKAKGNEGRTR